MQKLYPMFRENSVVIILSSSDFFSAYLGICIQSIIDTSNPQYNYDIIIIEREITDQNQKRICSLMSGHENISIRFKNVKEQMSNLNFYINGSRLSQETYYGLLVPWLLPEFHKAVIMDCDMIVKRDIADLYNIDLADKVGGGVRDINIQSWINDEKLDVDDYYKNTLKVYNPCNCFNGGLILLDFDKFKANYTIDKIVDYLENYQLRVVDQDIFNILLQDKVKLIDYGWNHMIRIDETRLILAPETARSGYLEAQKKPFIIHYAGEIKPWTDPDVEFGDDFWQIARKTPFYEIVLARMSAHYANRALESHTENKHKDRKQKLKSRVFIFIRDTIRVIFPAGTGGYKRIKCIYYKLRGRSTKGI